VKSETPSADGFDDAGGDSDQSQTHVTTAVLASSPAFGEE